MRASRKATHSGVAELNVLITEAVMLSRLQEETAAKLKAVRDVIKTTMEDLGLARHAAPDGSEALLIEKLTYTWDVDKLEDLLEPEEFEDLCPRRPEASKLRKWMESCAGSPAEKTIRSCAKSRATVSLEVRAAGEVTRHGEDESAVRG